MPSASGDSHESWRMTPEHRDLHRRAWLMIRRVSLTALVIGLIITLVWLLLSVRHHVPVVAVMEAAYRPPFGPLALVEEDRLHLRRYSRSETGLLQPATIVWQDAGREVVDAAPEEFLRAVARRAGAVRPGGPGNSSVIVYLAMIGTLNAAGEPCLLMPTATPFSSDETALLPLEQLIAAIRGAVSPGVDLLLVIDSCRHGLGWPLGLADGAFAAAVEAWVRSSQPQRTWVMLSASAGQRSHGDPSEGVSVFARHFADGLHGVADTKPFGDGDGRVGLDELAAYLEGEVDRWARLRFGESQRPVVFPSGGEATVTAWPQISWTISRRPKPLDPVLGRRTPTLSWLAARWRAAERLANAVHTMPSLWQDYLQLLLRAEHLTRAGGGYARERSRVETLVERLEMQLATSQVAAAAKLPVFLMHRLAVGGVTVAPTAIAEWDAAMKAREAVATKPPPPGIPNPSLQSWLGRAHAGWRWLMNQEARGLPVDQPRLAAWLTELGESPTTQVPEPVEIHTARMLARWLSPGAWQRDPGLPVQLLRLVGLSQSATLSPDVRADRVVDLVTDRAGMSTDLRRAIDLALVGDEPSLRAARRLCEEVAPRLEKSVLVAAEASESIRFSDRLHDELPWLAAWWVGEERAARSLADAPAGEAKGSGTPFDWRKLVDAVNRFEQAIDDVFRSADQRRSLTDPDDAISALARPRREVETLFQTLTATYFTACEELAVTAGDSPLTLARINRVLQTPLVRGYQREQLLERADRMRRHAAAQGGAPAEGPRTTFPVAVAAVTAGWIEWQQTATHPLLPILTIDNSGSPSPPTQPADVAAAVARQLLAVRQTVKTPPVAMAAGERTAQGGGSRSQPTPRAFLESREFLSRRMAVVMSDRESLPGLSSMEANFVAAWHDRLVAAAADSLEDFWEGVESDDPPWYLRSATAFLQAAAEIVQAAGISYGEPARREIEERLMAAESAGGLGVMTSNPEVLTIFPPVFPGATPANQVRFTADRTVPSGVASLWFADSVGGRPFSIAAPVTSDTTIAAPGASVERLAVPFENAGDATVSWRLTDDGRRQLNSRDGSRTGQSAVIDMVAWYRGHRMVAALPVLAAGSVRTMEWQAGGPRPPTVTVRGDMARNQSVAVVFDCSGSMGERLSDGRTRLEAGREALAQTLEGMAREGGWAASLWLYGHRTRWSRDDRGRFSPGFTAEGERQRDAAVADGRPFSLLPGDDVERVFDMQPLSPVQVVAIREVLDRQKPGGETPLYRAIEEAIRVDLSAAEPGPAHVLVVTDGANDQSGGKITTSSDVQRLLSLVNVRRSARDQVRIDVIGFDLDADVLERQLRLQDLQSTATDSGGKYFDARNPRTLAESLRKSLRMIRWQAQAGTDQPLTAAVGEPLRLPIPFAAGGDVYDISLEGDPARRRITVHGGEAVELFVGGGNRLVFHRYTGGLEQGLRDQRADLPDPADPDRRWFVGAHLARREGSTVSFPISIQSGPPDGFSPRPVEAWVEVIPQAPQGRAAAPYVVYDPSWQPHRPVPVLEVTATQWPDAATVAHVRSWFRFTPAEPLASLPIADLVPGIEIARDLPGMTGSTIRAELAPVSDPSAIRLTVIEAHPARLADQLPILKVAVSAGCRRAVHILEPGTGRLRHEFELEAVDGQLQGGVSLTVTDREAIIQGSVGIGMPGTTIQPLMVPVPPP